LIRAGKITRLGERVMKRKLISVSTAWLCLTACLSGSALLSAPITWRSAQVSQATKAAERAAVNNQNSELKSLYEAHQWFKLRDAVQATDAPAFYLGAVASVFNDIKQAEKSLQSVIKSAPQSEQAAEARELLINAYMRAALYRRALSETAQALSAKPNDSGLKNARALFSAFSQYPEQSVAEHRFSAIRYQMKDGNLFIPLEVNGKQASYIVDSGANFSLISEAEAKRLGLELRESSGATMGDASGAQIGFRIAVADRLTVGRMRLRHVPFFVMRDDQQPFVDLPSGERGIIGLPVLLAFQSVRWNREGKFEIGFATRATPPLKSNMCFEGAQPIVEAEFRQSKINLFLDTGATHTRVLPLFAREFTAFVNESGKKGSQRVTGVGGSVEVETMTLPELRLRISGPELVLKPAEVLLKETASDLRWSHVWIGMDMLNQARSVTLDFKSMTLALE
jgi:predicted aspartyl protease